MDRRRPDGKLPTVPRGRTMVDTTKTAISLALLLLTFPSHIALLLIPSLDCRSLIATPQFSLEHLANSSGITVLLI
jgi:hypothetical protein